MRDGLARGEVGVGGGRHIPAAGPYYVADHNNEEYVILKRNPNYPGPRPQHFDAIVIREGIAAGLAVERIEQGGWDGITTLFDPLLDPGGQLDERWGPDSGRGGGRTGLRAGEWPATGYIAFNAGRGVFADPSGPPGGGAGAGPVRARGGVGPNTDRHVPAAERCRDRRIPSKVPCPDPTSTKARRLMGGRGGSAVMPVFEGCDPCLAEAQIVRDNLAGIGIDVRIRRLSNFDAVFAPGGKVRPPRFGSGVLLPGPRLVPRPMLLRDVPAGWLPGRRP